jgi:ABC-type sugar transport system permease subunit
MIRRKNKWHEESRTAYLMSAPAFLLVFGLGIFPVLYTIWLSFNKINPANFFTEFIGLNNYLELFNSSNFWSSIGLTFYFTVVSLALQFPLGILVSMLLNQEFKGRWFVRALILLPWAVPTIVNANLWNWILNANYGILNRVLLKLHLIDNGIAWLSNARLAMNMVIVADTWKMLPLVIIMLLAALQTVPKDSIEAASIDGAGPFRRFISIYLPYLKPMLMVTLVLRTIQTFRVFDIIYALTRGGPANGTMVISFYAYFETFNYLNYGKGSAIAIIVSFLTLVFSVIYMWVLRTNE